MKYLNGEYYVEVKDHRNKIHPFQNIILRNRDPPQPSKNSVSCSKWDSDKEELKSNCRW